jgi:transposase
MKREDGRKLSADAQEERRKTIVRMRKQGKKLWEIEEAVSLSRTAVCKALKNYRNKGWKGLKGGKRGRSVGTGRSLTPEQEKIVRLKIIDRRPEQLKMDFALWTREAVRQLIFQICNIDMPIRTVGGYLRRWGFTPQKPVKFAYERRPEKVKEWLEQTFPEIRERAKNEKAEIYWGDETGLRAGDVRGRGFAPPGATPIVNATAKYENLSMISAITNKGRVQWMIADGTINAERFIEFLTALCKDSRRKIFLILDNLRVHHSKPLKEWLIGREKKIELFYLPSYSPDLNPDEHVNSDLKQGIGSKVPVRTKKRLQAAATEHMQMLSKNRKRIRKYFKDPAIQYASASY